MLVAPSRFVCSGGPQVREALATQDSPAQGSEVVRGWKSWAAQSGEENAQGVHLPSSAKSPIENKGEKSSTGMGGPGVLWDLCSWRNSNCDCRRHRVT